SGVSPNASSCGRHQEISHPVVVPKAASPGCAWPLTLAKLPPMYSVEPLPIIASTLLSTVGANGRALPSAALIAARFVRGTTLTAVNAPPAYTADAVAASV